MNDQEKNDIIISSIEILSWGLKVKDEKGLVYNIPQYKKDTQEETVAYQKITKLPNNGMNLKKTFSFVIVNNSQGGQSRYVRNIFDLSGQPNTINRGEQIARQGITQDKTKNEEAKWEKINEEKEKSMRWMNALNNATLLVANGKVELKNLKHQANLIYEMKQLSEKVEEPTEQLLKAEDLGEEITDDFGENKEEININHFNLN
jgi:hypothetical protein